MNGDDTVSCPHCGGKVWEQFEPAEYGGRYKTGPDSCEECGACEMYDWDADASDVELATGWWLGENGITHHRMSPADKARAGERRNMAEAFRVEEMSLAEIEREAAEKERLRQEEEQRRLDARALIERKYVDEALF